MVRVPWLANASVSPLVEDSVKSDGRRTTRIASRRQIIDLIGIVGLTAIGAALGYYSSASFFDLMPNVPLLSTEDWPGSKYNGEPEEVEQFSLEADRSRLRIFRVGLVKSERGYYGGTHVSQASSWYAEPTEAFESLEIDDQVSPYSPWPDVLQGEPLSSYLQQDSELTSAYLCADPEPLSGDLKCVYVANVGHWKTTIWFDIEGGDHTSQQEVQELINRARQLLLSADAP